MTKSQERQNQNPRRACRFPLWPVKAALATALLLGASGLYAGRTTLDRTALVVNREVLTKGELEESVGAYFVMQGIKPPDPSSAEFKKARREVAESVIREILLAQEADNMSLTVNEAEIDKQVSEQIEGIRKRFGSRKDFEEALVKEGITEEELKTENRRKLLRQTKAQRAMAAKREEMKGQTSVPDEQVKARFQKRPADFDQARVSVIFFRIPADAQKGYAAELKKQAGDILARLQKGEDFAALAKKYSEDPAGAEHGGDMGELFRCDMETMDRGFGDGVMKLGEKQLGVVTGQQGVYVVRVSSKRKAAYADAVPAIRRQLQGGLQGDALDSWFKELRAKAYVKEMP